MSNPQPKSAAQPPAPSTTALAAALDKAGIDTAIASSGATALTLKAAFGEPTFKKPENPIWTKNKKAQIACRMFVPFANLLIIECTAWLRREEQEGKVVEEISIALPQNVKIAEEHLDAWQDYRADMCSLDSPLDRFLYPPVNESGAVASAASHSTVGKLVRVIAVKGGK